MRVIGIDPGKTGGLVMIEHDGAVLVWDMPTYQEARTGKTLKGKAKAPKVKVDVPRLAEILKTATRESETIVYIERQWTWPGEGAVQSFNHGEQYGRIIGMLAMRGVPFETPTAQAWQKEFGVAKPKGSKTTKGVSYAKASALFPGVTLKTERGRILDGRCDALLIAEYGRRKHGGNRPLTS